MFKLYKIMLGVSAVIVLIYISARIITVVCSPYSCQCLLLHDCFCLILWVHSSNKLHLVIYIIVFAYIWFRFANILFRMFASILMSNFLIQSLPGFDRMDWEMFFLFLVFGRVYFRMGGLVDRLAL